MKFGLSHSVQLPNPSEQDRYYRESLEQVLHTERLGYNSVWFTEHHFTRHGIVSATTTVLAYLAGVTETIRLGTAVTVLPFHNPIQLAEQTATVDVLSNGRLDLGVGRGYQWGEFHRMNIPMNEASRRFEESMEVLTRAWTSIEPFDHRGRVLELQRPHGAAPAGAAAAPTSIRGGVWRGQRGTGGTQRLEPAHWPRGDLRAGSRTDTVLPGRSRRSRGRLQAAAGGGGTGHVHSPDHRAGAARCRSALYVVQADRAGSQRAARPADRPAA